MAERQRLNALLRRSCIGFVAIVAATVTFGCLTQAFANGRVRDHTAHLARGWKAERDFGHGWGWDATVGFYEGPFWGRRGKGYFRCFDPGYGWHSCPFDGVLAAQPRRWGGLWHRRS
jgi:hypothetical protein